MMHSENILVQYMARRSLYNVLGTLGTNRVVLRYKFGMPTNNCVFNCLYMTCEEDIHRAHMIRGRKEGRNLFIRYKNIIQKYTLVKLYRETPTKAQPVPLSREPPTCRNTKYIM